MSGMITTSTTANALKLTLDKIIDDKTDGYDSSALMHKWMDEPNMTDAWVDDLEMGGPPLASEKPEGQEIATGSYGEGYIMRYIARTYGLKLIISDETMEDNKYPETIALARKLKRSMWKSIDIDATGLLKRMFNTQYTFGDGQPIASASHTLPAGGTWSNVMATPMSPSRAAVIIAVSQMKKYPGHDGITEGVRAKKVLCPTEQWAVWDGLTLSTHAPEPGQFNEINVVNRLKLEVLDNQYWDNTTTNWCILTDNDCQPEFKWRRRPRSRSWVDNDQEVKKYSISSRWARGISDARAFYCVEA